MMWWVRPPIDPEGRWLSALSNRTQFQARQDWEVLLKVRFSSMSQQGGTSGHLPCFFSFQPTTLFRCLASLTVFQEVRWMMWTHNVRLETHDEMSQVFVFQLCLCITFTRKFFLVGFNWLNEDLCTFSIQLWYIYIIQKRAVLLSLYIYFTGRDSVNFLSCFTVCILCSFTVLSTIQFALGFVSVFKYLLYVLLSVRDVNLFCLRVPTFLTFFGLVEDSACPLFFDCTELNGCCNRSSRRKKSASEEGSNSTRSHARYYIFSLFSGLPFSP